MLLNPEEDFAAVHPPEEQPLDEQHADPEEEWFESGPGKLKQRGAEVAREGSGDEVVEEMGDEVGGDGVHADHDEEERPGAAIPDVHDEIERGEKEKTPAARKKHPTRRPNPFHHWADSQPTEN